LLLLRLRIISATLAVFCTLVTGVLCHTSDSLAQVAAAELLGTNTQDDDDTDPNLVPLEPELTITPPDLPSTDDKVGNTGGTIGQVPSVAPDGSQAQVLSQPQSGSTPIGTAYNIPIVIDPTVQSHIHFFSSSIRGKFDQWLTRFSRYRPIVENIFAEFNLPSDLVNLSLVESGFNPYAFSRAKATGPWQFMKGTGKVYGLRIDHYVDERRDPIKSTVAAARYLRDLYDLFGTWPLAMAAYNAGEGKVMRALHKAHAETFSDISKTKLIRRETKQYVPRIMAATVIARNLDQYGFSQTPAAPHQFEEVIVNRGMHFKAISSTTGIPYEDLRLLNPELRRDATPPYDSAYHLKVPVGTSAKVTQLLDQVPTYKFPPMPSKSIQVKEDSSKWYRVRVGDSLEKISKRFHVPLRTLKTRNKLSSHGIKAGEFLLISR
jgi:membrane-bound lytic murein transglycosylase D